MRSSRARNSFLLYTNRRRLRLRTHRAIAREASLLSRAIICLEIGAYAADPVRGMTGMGRRLASRRARVPRRAFSRIVGKSSRGRPAQSVRGFRNAERRTIFAIKESHRTRARLYRGHSTPSRSRRDGQWQLRVLAWITTTTRFSIRPWTGQ